MAFFDGSRAPAVDILGSLVLSQKAAQPLRDVKRDLFNDFICDIGTAPWDRLVPTYFRLRVFSAESGASAAIGIGPVNLVFGVGKGKFGSGGATRTCDTVSHHLGDKSCATKSFTGNSRRCIVTCNRQKQPTRKRAIRAAVEITGRSIEEQFGMINSKRKKVARSKLWRLQQGKCCYCREPMTRTGEGARRATLEHLRRLCDGGTSRLDNLALACRDCNAGRGSVDWLTYASLKQGEMYNEA